MTIHARRFRRTSLHHICDKIKSRRLRNPPLGVSALVYDTAAEMLFMGARGECIRTATVQARLDVGRETVRLAREYIRDRGGWLDFDPSRNCYTLFYGGPVDFDAIGCPECAKFLAPLPKEEMLFLEAAYWGPYGLRETKRRLMPSM